MKQIVLKIWSYTVNYKKIVPKFKFKEMFGKFEHILK